MSLSKKTRFEIFKRDKFTCQYCGNRPPDVVLEVDHITPVCEGGSDEYTNLITSCFDCNRGKGGRVLEESDCDLVQAMHFESIAQLTAYNEMLRASIERRTDSLEWLKKKIAEAMQVCELTDAECNSLYIFSRKLDIDQILDASYTAGSKGIKSRTDRWKYFCGVCWRKIKDD